MKKIATKQAEKVSPRSGTAPPKERQFGQPGGNPRHNGAWKKEDTARFKLEQMFKMSEPELRAIAEDRDAPLFEQKLATCIKTGKWREIKEMIDEVYGLPRERRELELSGELSDININIKRYDNER